jgi:TPP-dependent pyruvate/acetoin dehydrogenase alpha subunit
MMHKNWLTEDEDTAIQEEAKDEIVNAVKFAEESPYPTVANVTTDVLAPKQEVA